MITVMIDGREIKLEKAVTVLEAARSAGIKIPTLCWHEQLEKYGGCRLCLVEVEKMPRLQTACTLMAADGMVVRTETEAIADVRRGILEFLLINHPLDCPYCDKAGECELQDLVEKYGPARGRFREEKRKTPESLDDPVIVRNMERCVMCTRCVRMCEGVQGVSAISVIGRGGHSHVEPFSGGRFDCEYCGNCVSVCPVGAIMSRLHRHSYRPWQVGSEVETICPYCGVGCTVVAQVRDDVIKRVVPRISRGINHGMLCSRGRFGYEFVGSGQRLTSPLVRKNGVLEQTTWEEAIGLVSKRLQEIKGKYGSAAIAGIASARCTNEDNYVFQKFMRTTVGTNNIDSVVAMGYAGAQAFLENIFGQGATANIIHGIANSDAVFVAGADPTAVNPILGLQVRSSARKGGRIITLGRMNGLRHYSPLVLNASCGTDSALLEALVCGVKDKKGLSGANATLEAEIGKLSFSASDASSSTGVSEKDIEECIEALSASATSSILIGKDIVQSSGNSWKLLLIAALSYLVNGKIYLLSDRPNEQGALDAGCSPDMLPGNRPLSSPEFRKRFESLWNAEIPEKSGLGIFEMISAAKEGSLKAMYVMGENPIFNLPNSASVEAALKNLEFLVVQDIFMTETAKVADVVLPALSWGEKSGTFTNMERRIQLLRKAVHREAMDDWKIICEISSNMGSRMDYSRPSDVFGEISRISPLYRDLSHSELEKASSVYPYKGEPLRGIEGKIGIQKPESPEKGDVFLRVDRPLFHSGTLSVKSPALVKIYSEAAARIGKSVAESWSLQNGDMVRVSTRTGAVILPVAVDESIDGPYVLISNNFEKAGVFGLMEYVLDPFTKAPCLDLNRVSLEKVNK